MWKNHSFIEGDGGKIQSSSQNDTIQNEEIRRRDSFRPTPFCGSFWRRALFLLEPEFADQSSSALPFLGH